MPADLDFLTTALVRLDSCLAVLRRLAALSESDLLTDPIPLGSAERYLQVSIEICLDIAHHLISAEGLRVPGTYADAFAVLVEGQIVPVDYLPTAQRMARFRNRLVHLYWDVEAEAVYAILQTRLGDFERYKAFIVAYMSRSAA